MVSDKIPGSLERLPTVPGQAPAAAIGATAGTTSQRQQQETAAFYLERGRALFAEHRDREAIGESLTIQDADDAAAPFRDFITAISGALTLMSVIAVFVGANFVASIVLTWMPSFLYRKFGMSLGAAGFSSTFYLQIASVLGVISGGVLADRLARRRPDGRMTTQAIGLMAGVPFIFITGWTLSVPVLVLALAGFGYFKGLYDANIWASLHDVVPARLRAMPEVTTCVKCQDQLERQRKLQPAGGPVADDEDDE